jgi:ABC-type branched-subunit amino acid transport system permease subunit
VYQWAPFGRGSPVSLILAAAFAVPFGFLMTLPALRLQGLYLALASLAFARMAESLFFDQPEVFGNGAQPVPRLSVFGYRFTDQRNYLLLVTAVFGVMAIGVVWLRRGRFGRRLIALRDSEAACATLGVNRFRTKLAVYTLAAAMAGFAGALLGMQRGTAATQDFQLLSPLAIPIVLLIVVGGVETVSGALIGGTTYILFVVMKENFDTSWLVWVGVIVGLTVAIILFSEIRASPSRRAAVAVFSGALMGVGAFLILDATFQDSWLAALERLGPGLLAVNVALRPNGASVELGFALAPLLPWRPDARRAFMAEMRQRMAGKGGPREGGPPGEPVEPAPEAPVPSTVPASDPTERGVSWKAPT